MNLTPITFSLFCIVNLTAAQTSLPPQRFKEQLKKENGVLIDVRTPEEYRTERIAGSININVNDSLFVSEINKLDRKKYYFLYCGVGKRSGKALAILKENGFTNVFDLEKGLTQWKAEGLPTIKGNDPPKD